MNNLSLLYHWNTSMQFGSELVNRENIRKALLSESELSNISKSIKLQDVEISLFTNRKTRRDFSSNTKISLTDLSILLDNSIRQKINFKEIECSSPSAGGLYPIKMYLLINKVENLERGIYKYNELNHSIEFYRKIKEFYLWENAFLNQSFTKEEKFSVAFIFVLDINKISCKYGERGYRYALLEAGHIAQNLQLISTQINLCSVPVGGYVDNDINELLNLSHEKYLPIYAVFIGK